MYNGIEYFPSFVHDSHLAFVCFSHESVTLLALHVAVTLEPKASLWPVLPRAEVDKA